MPQHILACCAGFPHRSTELTTGRWSGALGATGTLVTVWRALPLGAYRRGGVPAALAGTHGFVGSVTGHGRVVHGRDEWRSP